jgi:O-antigen/teichoic acid export membrane protein
MKATSLFGGVQVFTILISIVRSKIVAILLGTAGIGLIGLYQTTISLISSITGMGLSSSAVRNISEANGTNDEHKIALVIKTLRRWVWMTGMVGAVVTLSLAPLLSKWTFGNENYTWSFVWLSIICLLSAISSGQNVLLQGMRRLRQMAKSTLFGSIIGLFTSIPLYYFFGVNGIVPSLIISTVSALSISYYFARQIPVQKVEQSWSETYHSGLGMAKLGFVMMLSSFMVTLVSYAVNLFIRHKGGLSDVGLYRAGWTIADQYTAIIFTAMATDYYPRLAAINSDKKKLGEAVNQQAEIALLILGPMLVALIGFAPLVVNILYTAKFLPVIGMIKWNLVGMLFKAASWALAFTIIAKGDNRLFFMTETIANAIVLILNIIGYSLWGLNGIGIAFTLSYLLYFILIFLVVRKKYGILYNTAFLKIFVIQSSMVFTVFLISFLHAPFFVNCCVGILFIFECLYSLRELNKRMDLRSILQRFKK